MIAEDVKQELSKYASTYEAEFLQKFFKTGPGQYGEGDIFIGIRVPKTRLVCKQFQSLGLKEVQKLLNSKIHEHRLAGLIILTHQFSKADADKQKLIYELYLRNVYLGRINNWDLVDLSADKILGKHLIDKPKDILYELARSDKLWEKRVAMISTFQFIKSGEPAVALDIAQILLHDKHDLIQKAVGWMLREIGKRCDPAILTEFLDMHAHNMPRTALRYSIERFNPDLRMHYMNLAKHKNNSLTIDA